MTLLRRLGVEVDFPEAQTCCGQPMVNTGYLDEAVPVVRGLRPRPSTGTTRSSRRPARAPGRRGTSTGSSRGARATPALVAAVARTVAADLRAVGVPRRRARGDRRRRVLPAPRDLPPDLPLAADARRRRPARRGCCAPSAASTWSTCRGAEECCGFGGTFAVKNADTSVAMVLRQGPPRPRDRRRGAGRRRQLLPDAHRRRC